MIPERGPAPERRHDLIPRFPSPLSVFHFADRSARSLSRPTKLTHGAAAATVVVVAAGVAAGLSAGSSPAINDAAALNHAAGQQLGARHAGRQGTVARQDAASPGASATTRPTHQRMRVKNPGRVIHPAHVRRHSGAHLAVANQLQTLVKRKSPYLIYDSVIPSAIPASQVAAVYATGPFAASPSQLAGKGPVLWIDTIGSDPAASALDVEPGDATPSLAASWAQARLSQNPNAIARIYTTIAEWQAVQAAISGLPSSMRSRVRWWIADPTGFPHVVPGSDATQWYWGQRYDISTATPRF